MQILVRQADGFQIFCNTYPDCVHGQLFEKWDKTLSVPKTWPELTVFASSHRFPHKDFIGFFRIVFPVKCHSTEDIGIYLWPVNKNEQQTVTRKHSEKLLFVVDRTILRENVVRFSLSHFSGGLWMITFTMFDQKCFHQDFNTSQESLKPTSFSKFTVEPFVLRCRWTLRWKYVRVESFYATPFLSFTKVLQWKTVRIWLFFSRSSLDRTWTRLACRILFYVYHLVNLVGWPLRWK